MKKKNIILIVSIFVVLLLIAAGTYAYWSVNHQESVVFSTAEIEKYIVYDEGNSSFVGNFEPTDYFCNGLNTTISFYKTEEAADLNLRATINMDVNSIGENISNSTSVFWVLTIGNECYSNNTFGGTIVNTGEFEGVTAGDVITLESNIEVTTTEQEFTIWISIDSGGTDLDLLSGETLDVNIWTQFDMLDSNSIVIEPEEPVLDEGMIPVTIAADGTTTTISSTDSNWYDYGKKKWANVVLVDSDSRSTYLNTSGVTVSSSDILAYYVWIPRYRYKIWTTSVSSKGNEQTIDIVFESATAAMSNGTTVGSYRTHPAFWWDNDSDGVVDDGEMLAGFWVGKFETAGSVSAPTVLPNVLSMRTQKVSAQFTTSLKFAGGTLSNGTVTFAGSSTYGLTATTDSHMAKNSEWGAVAYLSHSKYGINQEIYINNSSDNYTGRSGGNVGGSQNTLATQFPDSSTSSNAYNSSGYYTWTGQEIDYSGNIGSYASDTSLGTNASTTGNVTGVYDMSGGAYEYVMGVFSDSSGNPRSGYSSSGNSGFNGLIYDDTEYTSGIAFPESKYYDLYLQSQFGTDGLMSLCTLNTCGGHALFETAGWYDDKSSLVYYSDPWFIRGGSYATGIYSGAFYALGIIGNFGSGISWRSVLVVGVGA